MATEVMKKPANAMKRPAKKQINTDKYLSMKYGPVTNKEGTVFRIPCANVGFFNMRVNPKSQPIVVRGGSWHAILQFNFEEGTAKWVSASQEEVRQHMGDKASYLHDIAQKKWEDDEKQKQEELAEAQQKLAQKQKEKEEKEEEKQKEEHAARTKYMQEQIKHLTETTEKLKSAAMKTPIHKLEKLVNDATKTFEDMQHVAQKVGSKSDATRIDLMKKAPQKKIMKKAMVQKRPAKK